MHSFEVHSNETVCRNSGCLGMEQVTYQIFMFNYPMLKTYSDKITLTLHARVMYIFLLWSKNTVDIRMDHIYNSYLFFKTAYNHEEKY